MLDRKAIAYGTVVCAVLLTTGYLIGQHRVPSIDGTRASGPVPTEGSARNALAASSASSVARIPASGDWWGEASRAIESMEYIPSSGDGREFQAPNRSQGFRTRFRESGVEVVPRVATEGRWDWTWSWKTTRFGRAPSPLASVAARPVHSQHGRVTYARDGFTEWYENRPEGLEQGFTIPTPPAGAGDILVVGRIDGTFSVSVGDEGTLLFHDPRGEKILCYGRLVATDAQNSLLPSELALAGDEIRIRVDDTGATYPIVIDPVLEIPSWEYKGGQEEARLGQSCSTVGDVNGDGFSDVAVSAPSYDSVLGEEGKVFVFYGSPTGLGEAPDWSCAGDRHGVAFGSALGPAGDVNGDGYHDLIVTAADYDNPDGSEGRVFVYEGSASGLTGCSWSVTSTVSGLTGFGVAVGTAGDVDGDGFDDVIIGEYRYPFGGITCGRVWVYPGSAGGLKDEPLWLKIGDQDLCYYGADASTAGDVNADGYADIIVSASRYTGGAISHSGRVFLYLGSPEGPAVTPAWTADGTIIEQRFGVSIGDAGDVDGDGYADVVVGTLYTNPEVLEGAAFVYRGSSTGLEAAPAWSAEGNAEEAYFGISVCGAGDVNGDGLADVLIGAEWYPVGGIRPGHAFLYYGARTGLSTTPSWIGESDQDDCYYGLVTAPAGDVNGDGFSDFLVAAQMYDGGDINEGKVYLYNGSGDGPRTTPGWAIDGNQANSLFGHAISNAGDVNGDGFDDILVGASRYDNGQEDEGAAFLFLGHGVGPSVYPDWWAESNQIDANLGSSVAGAGDVNGDGYDDVMIGAPMYDALLVDEGRAFLWYGSPTAIPMGTPSNASWSGGLGQAGAVSGNSVAGIGDVNGDGYADAAIGSMHYSNGQTNEGAVQVYLGSSSGLSTTAIRTFESDQAEARLGYSVSGAGDVNADGYCDLLAGAPRYTYSVAGEGAVFLYRGWPMGVEPTPAWVGHSAHTDAMFGITAASAGDVNGDGYSDILIGAPEYPSGGVSCGAFFAWYGSGTGIHGNTPMESDYIMVSDVVDAQFGRWVASGGDINGDGFSDVIVGAPYDTNHETGETERGGVVVAFGSPDGIDPTSAEIYGSQSMAGFGVRIASADVNGDGFADVLVGAPNYTQGETSEGRAYVFYGNGSRGLARASDQLASSLTRPIGLRGNSDASAAVGLRAQLRTPSGRGNVRIEYEIKPFGVPFDGTAIGSSGFYDTGTPVSGLGSARWTSEMVAGLSSSTAFHWRMRLASDHPIYPHTPWFSPSGNAWTETDFRTAAASAEVASGPTSFEPMLQCAPNPSARETRIRYVVGAIETVTLTIHDVQGRRVRTIVHEAVPQGMNEAVWNGEDDAGRRVARGVYWARLVAGGLESRREIVRIE
jgi:hypothetical protein